jgi:transcription antitermination factor NusG
MKAHRHAVVLPVEIPSDAEDGANEEDEELAPPTPPASAWGLDWYALAIAPHRDFEVWRAIDKAGITVYCPLRTNLVKPHRHARTKIERAFPLLEGYLFVGFPEGETDWPAVLGVKYVKGRIGINDRPSQIRPAQMERLLVRQAKGIYRGNGALRGMMREESHVRVGDMVSVDVVPGVKRHGIVTQVIGRRAILEGLGLLGGCSVIVEDLTTLELTDV